MTIDIEKITQQITELGATHGLKLLSALITLWIGWKVIKLLCKGLQKWFEKTEFDEALETFIHSLVSIALKVILVITCAGIAGFPTTSFVAVLGAAGLAVGMALSGTLQNFAGGVLILILKPFKVGDVIETQGHTGKVRSIQIFNTIINTADNKRIILPNGPVATDSLVNYSAENKRRVDFTFGIGYDDDIDKARSVLTSLIEADTRIDKDPEPFIAVQALADSSVNLVVRVWANSSDYWGVHFDLNENVKKTFDQEGISFPYPQTDVHLHKLEAE
ncbi:MAG: mechanosensitive ion channel [Verrucomicrobiae bacterium]|nr:mechanosensitive ion channel [Verrucomicrobiae bacterium]NNJ86703.1 mechanosensitive ion channel [Akkermansiaceae bacterium]